MADTIFMGPGHKKAMEQRALVLATQSPAPDKLDLVNFALDCYALGQESITVPNPPSLEDAEKMAIVLCLKKHKGHRVRAAQQLGIGKTTLYRKVKEYGLEEVDITDKPQVPASRTHNAVQPAG